MAGHGRRAVVAGGAAGAALLALGLAPVRGQVRWRAVSEENFPPYNFPHEGRRVGIDVDIVNAVAKRLGVELAHEGLPWNRVINELEQNQTDIGFQFVGTPERHLQFNLVGPHRSGLTVFMVAKSSPLSFESLADLKGKTVGIVQGFRYTADFDAAADIVKEAAVDNATNVRKLAGGRLDAVVGDRDTLLALAASLGATESLRILPKALAEVPRFIALPKPRSAAAQDFAKALDAAKAAGEIDAILQRWRKALEAGRQVA